MKKVFAILLAVSALSLLLAGCKKDDAAAEPAATPPADAGTK